jgi:hypothetical protein
MKAFKAIAWFFRDYASRHRNNWNRLAHLIGVPLAPFGCLALLAVGELRLAALFFLAGYLLQWIGHRIEGNEVGEWILIKLLAAKAVRPRPARET